MQKNKIKIINRESTSSSEKDTNIYNMGNLKNSGEMPTKMRLQTHIDSNTVQINSEIAANNYKK